MDKNFQGLGIGRELLRSVEEALASQGVKVVYLSVKSWNTRALNFYLSNGYGVKGVVFTMASSPENVKASYIPKYAVADVSASCIKRHRVKPSTWWSSLVDEVDVAVYKKFYKQERAVVAKKNGRVKGLATYSLNEGLAVDSIYISSYSNFEALSVILNALKNVAIACSKVKIEIPVDASKKQFVKALKEHGFRVVESEYLLFKEIS